MAALALSNLTTMNDVSFQFLVGVLGSDGAKVLKKATERVSDLDRLLVPRSALSWVMSRSSFEGAIPGMDNSYLKFAKSEAGFDGMVMVRDIPIDFQGASPEYVAAAIGVAVGIEGVSPEVNDKTLMKFGKSIDVLVQAQSLIKSMAKIELPGQTAKPLPQGGPIAATAPQKQPKMSKPKLPRPSKVPALKVEKSEAEHTCDKCGKQLFNDGRFKPCICFADLSKSIRVTTYKDGWVLEFNGSVDHESVRALSKVFKR